MCVICHTLRTKMGAHTSMTGMCGFADHLWWSPRAGTRNQYAYPQLQLYQRCLDTFGRHHRHMAFIDSDEVRAAYASRSRCGVSFRVQGVMSGARKLCAENLLYLRRHGRSSDSAMGLPSCRRA